MVVMELVANPDGAPLTLMEALQCPDFTTDNVREVMSELMHAFQDWRKPQPAADLITSYLPFLHTQRLDRIRALRSEISANRWFVPHSHLDTEEQVRSALRIETGGRSCICHGDLHASNILVEQIGRSHMPVLIDFYRTGPAHHLKDLVTLELDLVIRAPQSIFKEPNTLDVWLRQIAENDFSDTNDLLLAKLSCAVLVLREFAHHSREADTTEYGRACILQTLNMLSFGTLSLDQRLRATEIVNHWRARLEIS
jgi:thiamine kinase-like enzyme